MEETEAAAGRQDAEVLSPRLQTVAPGPGLGSRAAAGGARWPDGGKREGKRPGRSGRLPAPPPLRGVSPRPGREVCYDPAPSPTPAQPSLLAPGRRKGEQRAPAPGPARLPGRRVPSRCRPARQLRVPAPGSHRPLHSCTRPARGPKTPAAGPLRSPEVRPPGGREAEARGGVRARGSGGPGVRGSRLPRSAPSAHLGPPAAPPPSRFRARLQSPPSQPRAPLPAPLQARLGREPAS